VGGLSGLLEPVSQLTQADSGLTFQVLLAATILQKSQTHLDKEIRGESEDTSFTLGAEGQSWRAVRFAMSAVTGGFAAAASQGN
jgi:hypothetical protein